MTDIWVCTTCHSINRQRDNRCYKCGAKQEDVAAATGTDVRLEAAIVNRTVLGYRPAWPFAIVASVLILAVAALGAYLVYASLDAIPVLKSYFAALADGQTGTLDANTLARAQTSVNQQLLQLGLLIAAVLSFGLWLSRVVTNIPALGGGQPSTTAVKALVYPLIPILNLIKVPAMIQDALYRVDPKAGGLFMVGIAWFGLVGSYLVSLVGGWWISLRLIGEVLNADTKQQAVLAIFASLDQSVVLAIVTAAMVAAGSLFLVLIIWRIERRSRARDREIRSAILAEITPPVAAPAPGA